ncbi:MAG: protein kinase domain-containing protein [Thermomicrobiales bacterium]
MRELAGQGPFPGQILGRFRLVTLLGQGASAAVYLASDPTTGELVALRVFVQDAADPMFSARFRHAAAAAAALRHPHILPILDFGEDQNIAYIVRPYASAGSLRSWMGTPRSLPAIIRLLQPIAEALDYAHANGVVHGDLKPGNLLLAAPDHLLLADLGTAHALAANNNLIASALGRHGGTPEYLAPEQALGLPPDGRTDLYALAIIVYEALTGRPPFQAEEPGDTARVILRRHLDTAPPPPGALNPAVSPAVEAALLRALAKDPSERFSCGGDFFAALLAGQHEQPAGGALALHAPPRSAAGWRRPVQAVWGVVARWRDGHTGKPSTAASTAGHDARWRTSVAFKKRRQRQFPNAWCWWALVVYAAVMTVLAVGGGSSALASQRATDPRTTRPPAAISSPGAPASLQQSAATPSAPANQILGQPTAPAVATATTPPSPSPTATTMNVSTAVTRLTPTASPWTPAPTAGRAPATPTVTPPAFVATDRIGTEIPVNFRAGPGTDYPIVTTLTPGAALHATGESTLVADILWRQFRLTDGRLGWVRDLDVVPALP